MNVSIGKKTMTELYALGVPIHRIAALAICTWAFARFVVSGTKRLYTSFPVFVDATSIQAAGFSPEAAQAYLTQPQNTPHMKAVNSKLIQELVEEGVDTGEIRRSLGCSAKLIHTARNKFNALKAQPNEVKEMQNV